jgi:type I restriction enzyme S subunit
MHAEAREKWGISGGSAPDHWSFRSIEDLLATPKSIAVGVMYPGENRPGGIPLVKVSDVKSGRVNGIPDYFIGHDKDEEHRRTKLAGDELLITLVGNPGDCVLVTPAMKDWNVARAIAVVRFNEPALREWVRYALLSRPAQNFLSARFNTTVQRTLNLKDIRELSIPIPPQEERQRMVRFLSAIDDKIELNRKMNATLESMAQALFKSWFVDFDPVIDNALAAGNPIPEPLQARAEVRQALGDKRKPLPEAIQQQFPDQFVFTEEMGWVPEGWGIASLDTVIELIGGGTPKTSIDEYWGGDIPWFSVVDAPRESDVFCINTDKSVTQKGVENSSTKVLRIGTTIISARGTVGKCGLVGVPMAMNQSCYGIVGQAGYSDYYIYYTVLLSVADLRRRGHGSVFNTITRDTFSSILIPRCPVKLSHEFHGLVAGMLNKICSNLKTNVSLEDARNILLPKLLSGELRIPDAEKLVEEVG